MSIFFVTYVDDIIVIRNRWDIINQFIHGLAVKFALKDLGFLNHFLGIELIRSSLGFFLSQHHYIRAIFYHFSMLDAKPVATPLSNSLSLKVKDVAAAINVTTYHQLFGALQYLMSLVQIFVLLWTSYLSSCSIHLILISRLLSGFFVTLSKRSFMASFYTLQTLMPWLLTLIPIEETILMIIVLPVPIQFILNVI